MLDCSDRRLYQPGRAEQTLLTSLVISDAADASHQTIHSTLDNMELVNPTLLALDMLTQATKSRKLHLAGVEGTLVFFGLVTGTRQVAVKILQRPAFLMAEHAFIGISVPGSFGCDVLAIATGDKTRRVGDNVVAVQLADVLVHLLAIDTRIAAPRLEMQYKGRLRYEPLTASIEGARDVLGFVDAGVHVL